MRILYNESRVRKEMKKQKKKRNKILKKYLRAVEVRRGRGGINKRRNQNYNVQNYNVQNYNVQNYNVQNYNVQNYNVQKGQLSKIHNSVFARKKLISIKIGACTIHKGNLKTFICSIM